MMPEIILSRNHHLS